jgi:hypothetical protein
MAMATAPMHSISTADIAKLWHGMTPQERIFDYGQRIFVLSSPVFFFVFKTQMTFKMHLPVFVGGEMRIYQVCCWPVKCDPVLRTWVTPTLKTTGQSFF